MPIRQTWIAILILSALTLPLARPIAAQEALTGDHGAAMTGVDVSRIAPDAGVRLETFVPVRIDVDLSKLSAGDRQAVSKLIEASRFIGEIFLRQSFEQNPIIRGRLLTKAGAGDRLAAAALSYFDVSAGPWDRLDETPFIGSAARPPGAGFYPPDLTKGEFEAWVAAHPDDKAAFEGLFTIIRREGKGLRAVRYSAAYREWLEPAAGKLREAGALTANASLRSFLEKRAAAFLSDEYRESDIAWMDLDATVEITIGPYETYEDRLFGYKAAFESFVTLKDPEASARLAAYKKELPAMERGLPIPDGHKNLSRGTESPISVVDVIYTAGDTRAGVQTIAFNLPNDEKVREEKGSKKVLLRNFMNAKFDAILKPIASRIVSEPQLGHVTAEAFFNETLFHELSHGLGPGLIRVAGRETEVRHELKELFSSIEEAKADVMGAWNVLHMIGKKQFPESMRRDLFVTMLAGMFRSVRFGIEEAHGKGVALQYNYFKERGAILIDGSGRFAVDFVKFEPALKDLVRDLCMVQARGDYAGAKKMLDTYAVVPPEWKTALASLDGIPVDIRPVYAAAGEQD